MTPEDLQTLRELYTFLRKTEPVLARLAQRNLQLLTNRHRKALSSMIERLETAAAPKPEPEPQPEPKKAKPKQRAVYSSLIGDD